MPYGIYAVFLQSGYILIDSLYMTYEENLLQDLNDEQKTAVIFSLIGEDYALFIRDIRALRSSDSVACLTA